MTEVALLAVQKKKKATGWKMWTEQAILQTWEVPAVSQDG